MLFAFLADYLRSATTSELPVTCFTSCTNLLHKPRHLELAADVSSWGRRSCSDRSCSYDYAHLGTAGFYPLV